MQAATGHGLSGFVGHGACPQDPVWVPQLSRLSFARRASGMVSDSWDKAVPFSSNGECDPASHPKGLSACRFQWSKLRLHKARRRGHGMLVFRAHLSNAGLALVQAIDIPDGTDAPISMFSARFDSGPIEMKFREVHKQLMDHNFKSLMVSAGGADDFGDLTIEYLGELKDKHGVMIAVCTPNYGEITKSPYSTHSELRFAMDEGVKVLPLKVADVYPPEPPGGDGHPFDPKSRAKNLCRMVFKGSVVYLDCVNKSVREITAMIAHALLKK